MMIQLFAEERLCSIISVDLDRQEVLSVENFADDPADTAFGVVEHPSWTDFLEFLEDRCFPRNRQNVKWELKKLGLSEYDPLQICMATNGRNHRDMQWMTFTEDPLEKEKPYAENLDR